MPSFESEGDRLALLTELGDEVTYTPSGGAAKTIYSFVDKEMISELVGDAQVIGFIPDALCRTFDLTGTVLAGTLVHDGTTYTIREDLPDGTGMTFLSLEKA